MNDLVRDFFAINLNKLYHALAKELCLCDDITTQLLL